MPYPPQQRPKNVVLVKPQNLQQQQFDWQGRGQEGRSQEGRGLEGRGLEGRGQKGRGQEERELQQELHCHRKFTLSEALFSSPVRQH